VRNCLPGLSAPARSETERLWFYVPQNTLSEAHHLLSEIYGWFTERFDTKDLQEAKALLEDLGEIAKWGNGEKDKG
jgi:predicted ATPase